MTGPNGQALLHWSAADPIDGNPDFVPAAGVRTAPHKSAEAMSVEELFLSGVEAEKDGNEQTAQATYLAVLKRDPGYIPALVKMAWHELRAGNFLSAEGFLAPALARDDRNPETLYAAGVVYRAAHRWSQAQDMFWADIRFGGDPAPAYAQLGEIALTLQKYNQAIPLLYQSLSHNPADAMAAADLAVALRLAGRTAEAEKTITQALEQMPLLPYARAERWMIQTAREKAGQKAAPPDGGGLGETLSCLRRNLSCRSPRGTALLATWMTPTPSCTSPSSICRRQRLLPWFITIWPPTRARRGTTSRPTNLPAKVRRRLTPKFFPIAWPTRK